jgi:molybdopterin-guanine dinucleotide biosynthesis protein A
MTPADRTGVVLAGGFSTRFGEDDKALAAVDGEPMLVRVVDRLGDAVDSVVVNCRADQREAFETALNRADCSTPVQFAIDPTPDEGPLAGIQIAFESIKSEYTAVVACDMPWVDPALLDALFERAAGHDAAVPEHRDGHLQTVQAVYRTDTMRTVAAVQLADDCRSLHGALEELDVVVLPADELTDISTWQTLCDVNTRDEIDSFEGE